ncbi:unnamed protein product [Prunus brigantina]
MFSALIVAVQKKKPFLKEGSFPKRIQMARRLLLTLGTLMGPLLSPAKVDGEGDTSPLL